MTRRIPASLLFVSLLLACSSSSSSSSAPSKAPAAPAKKAEEAKVSEEGGQGEPTFEYTYTPVGKRDPFRSVLLDMAAAELKPDDTARPDCGPLCKWELEQLKLVAVISGVSNPLAMVEDPQKRGHVVRRGTFMGKRNGKVTQIRSGEIVVTEIFKDQMGKPHISPVVIRLPVDKSAKGQQEDQNLLGPEAAE